LLGDFFTPSEALQQIIKEFDIEIYLIYILLGLCEKFIRKEGEGV
jgi:hypothetical protein